MPNKDLVAIYLRVSTRDQSFRSQEKELLEYCRRRGWKQFQVYSEKAPGAKAPRTVLDQMMADARAGKFSALVIYKLDRLGRSLSHLLQIVNELGRLKISLIVPSQGIDTTQGSAVGDLQLSMLGAVGAFERETTRERTMSGIASARRRGKTLGRPKTGQDKIDQVIELRKPGRDGTKLGYEAIAKKTGLSIGLVWKILNPKDRKKTKLLPI